MNPPVTNGNSTKTNTKNGYNPRNRRGNWYKRGGGNRRVVHIPTVTPGSSVVNNITSQKQTEGPYKGWKLYFNNEAFVPDSITHKKIQAMESYITRNPESFSINILIETRSGNIDTKLLKSDDQFLTDWSSFSEDIFDNPEHTLSCMGCAVYQFVYDEIRKDTQQTLLEIDVDIISPPLIKIRPINYEPITQFKHLKVHFYGKLITIRGTVIRCGPSKLLCSWLAWKCDSCLHIQDVYQPDGVLTSPVNCSTKGCRSHRFHQLLSDPLTRTTDWQIIKLQETVANHQIEGGVPRTIEVELSEDLVGSCIPGDDITVTGVLKVQNNNTGPKGNGNNSAANMFLLYIEAVSLVKDKNQTSAVAGKHSIAGIEFAVKDYYAIQKIQAEEALVRLLVHSLCPTIFGQEIVKLGLLLGLFGSGSGVRSENRMDSHILLVGDPGLGKSQLLQACANVAPRGVYVCGNTSTSAGLTVSLSRESGGDFALEAGALVLADQGICCIDEFDKMSTQHQALLEAMEQQTISIAKGGVVCTLSARCGVLAAANPHGGHYNKGKTVSENLRLGSALLSRFDLVFILLDKPDQHLDTLLSEHVLALHTSIKKQSSSSQSVTSISNSSTSTSRYNPDEPLKERLRVSHGETLDLIPLSLLRKYIAYARKYVHTKLSPAAADVLQRFYMELRKQHQTNDSTPVTARQLQAMVRLTQARARLELRELATERDALDIVEVMRHSLVDIFSDNFGNLNFTRSQNGSGISSRSQVKKFLTLLTRYTEQSQKSLLDIMEIKRVAENGKIAASDVNGLISALNLQGFLIKKGNQKYQLLLSEY